jgi:putative endonuclease
MYYYIYVLFSLKDQKLYTGYTTNLTNRINQHHSGLVTSTKNRRPLILIYWEGCLNQSDATRREKYLKSGSGKNYIKNRLKEYFQTIKNSTGRTW